MTDTCCSCKRSGAPAAAKRPLAPSLKKPRPPSLAAKWGAACLDALGGHQRHKQQRRLPAAPQLSCQRHVRFCDDGALEEFERPATTAAEKACYHYSSEELGRMQQLAKRFAAHCASRFDGLPADTTVAQGYLTLPVGGGFALFFPRRRRRFYCLLQRNQLLCYTTPTRAAASSYGGLAASPPTTRLAVIRAQDAAQLPMQQQIALFGAHLPDDLARVLVVTTPNGDRVPLTAESTLAKRSWLHTLRKVTEVVEPAVAPSSAEDDEEAECEENSPTGSPVDKRHRANADSNTNCSNSGDDNTFDEVSAAADVSEEIAAATAFA